MIHIVLFYEIYYFEVYRAYKYFQCRSVGHIVPFLRAMIPLVPVPAAFVCCKTPLGHFVDHSDKNDMVGGDYLY